MSIKLSYIYMRLRIPKTPAKVKQLYKYILNILKK